ncbi:MAG: hypothetical protein ACR2H3_11760 [Acidimicrobiales bacterium]
MSTWDRIKAALRREKADLDEAVDEFTTKANTSLDQRERELNATPEERLAIEQERAAASDDEYEALRQRIEGESAP